MIALLFKKVNEQFKLKYWQIFYYSQFSILFAF